MSTSPIGSYRFFQKLYPLSLLAQLISKRATGCLRVFTDIACWHIYLEEGKLTYASCSDKLLERLDNQLQKLSQKIPTLLNVNRTQIRLMLDTKTENQPSQTDYLAICWLVNQNYINSAQAAILIEELAKEVLLSFLTLKQGNYEFERETFWDELPKFCYLDLRTLVEECQKQLQQQHAQQLTFTLQQRSPQTKSFPTPTKASIAAEQPSSLATDLDVPEDDDESLYLPPSNKSLYTVACIDDSPTVLHSIRSFLDENTFAVVAIKDPIKALMEILRSKPDLILLDVEMPNLDGYELCSLLRRHSNFKNTPIIMVTGRTGFLDKAKAKMVRASGYLTKPFTQSDLLKIVWKHLK